MCSEVWKSARAGVWWSLVGVWWSLVEEKLAVWLFACETEVGYALTHAVVVTHLSAHLSAVERR